MERMIGVKMSCSIKYDGRRVKDHIDRIKWSSMMIEVFTSMDIVHITIGSSIWSRYSLK